MQDGAEEGGEVCGNSSVRRRPLIRKDVLILRDLSLGKQDLVDDLGCGTGLLTSAAARKGVTVVAVDL